MSDKTARPMTAHTRNASRRCAEIDGAAGRVRLVRVEGAPADLAIEPDCFLVSLSLTPRRNAKGCFPRCWGSHHHVPVGELIALPPGEQVKIVGDGALFSEALVCEIRPELVTRYIGASFEWSDRHLKAALDVSDKGIHAILRRLADELRSPGIASETLVDHLVGQLAIGLARYWKAIPDGPVAGGLAAWRLRLVDTRLQAVGAPPSLQELAELCRISVRQLTRGFRASRGVSLGDYIANLRIGRAQRLLIDGQPVKSTAYQLGFSSTSSFSYAFRREIGVSPREFVQTMRPARLVH